jgi:hypothetical protein
MSQRRARYAWSDAILIALSASKSESALSMPAPWCSAQAAIRMSVAGIVTPLARARRAMS